MTGGFKIGDALATLGLSILLFVFAGSLLAHTGSAGIVLSQVLAFALPTLVLAATRPTGWLALGIESPRPSMLGAAALIATSMWIWNAYWIGPLCQHWASIEQNAAWEQVLAVDARPLLHTLLLFALLPALCEELLYRGVLAPTLAQRIGFWPGLLVSSLLFGLLHFNLSRLLPTALLGMAAGYVRLRSGSLWPAMLLHFLYNASLLVAATRLPSMSPLVVTSSVVVTTIAVYFAHKVPQSQENRKSNG